MYLHVLFNLYVNRNKPEAHGLQVIKPNVPRIVPVFISEYKIGENGIRVEINK
jgi:hypothetical protein